MRRRSKRVIQGDATRSAIVRAARTRFGQDGYGAASLRRIVAEAGVTKGAFYHHFDSKEELFRAVYEQVQREIGRAAFVVHLDPPPAASGETPGDRPRIRELYDEPDDVVWKHLIRGCRAYLEAFADPDVRRIVLLDGRAVLDEDERQRIRDDHAVVLLRADLRRAQRRGITRPLPLNLTAALLAGSLDEACTLVGLDPDAPSVDDAMTIIEAFLDGLLAPPRTPNPTAP